MILNPINVQFDPMMKSWQYHWRETFRLQLLYTHIKYSWFKKCWFWYTSSYVLWNSEYIYYREQIDILVYLYLISVWWQNWINMYVVTIFFCWCINYVISMMCKTCKSDTILFRVESRANTIEEIISISINHSIWNFHLRALFAIIYV